MASNIELRKDEQYAILAETANSAGDVGYVLIDVDAELLRFVEKARRVVEELSATRETSWGCSIRSVGPWWIIPLETPRALTQCPDLDEEVGSWRMPQLDAEEWRRAVTDDGGAVGFGLEVSADSVVAFGFDYSDAEFTSRNLLPLLREQTSVYEINDAVEFFDDFGKLCAGVVKEVNSKRFKDHNGAIVNERYYGIRTEGHRDNLHYHAEKDLWTAGEAPPKNQS